MRDHEGVWATDAVVSRPEPPPVDTPVMVDFEGFGFTMNGMVHNISEADVEEMITPTFAPEGYRGGLRQDVPGDEF